MVARLSGREGVAAAALTLRWGSYLAVLLDQDKPVWPQVTMPGVISRISDQEMALINIEASAGLAAWVDLYRAEPLGERVLAARHGAIQAPLARASAAIWRRRGLGDAVAVDADRGFPRHTAAQSRPRQVATKVLMRTNAKRQLIPSVDGGPRPPQEAHPPSSRAVMERRGTSPRPTANGHHAGHHADERSLRMGITLGITPMRGAVGTAGS